MSRQTHQKVLIFTFIERLVFSLHPPNLLAFFKSSKPCHLHYVSRRPWLDSNADLWGLWSITIWDEGNCIHHIKVESVKSSETGTSITVLQKNFLAITFQ